VTVTGTPVGGLIGGEEQLAAVLHALAEAVTVTDPSGRIVYANDAALVLLRVGDLDELLGAQPGDVMGRFAVYDEDGRDIGLHELPGFRILAGAREAEPLVVRNVVRATGEQRWLLNKASSVRDARGALVGVVNVIADVTEAKLAERSQRLLARASEALAASLDYPETLQRVAEVAVPALADWAVVDLPGRGGRIEPVAMTHADPARAVVLRELRKRHPLYVTDGYGVPAVIRGGHSELLSVVPDEVLATYAHDEDELCILREAGFASLMIVPLPAGLETIGALTFGSADPLRPFGLPELELAEELGRRAGVAVLNARLYTRRTEIAQALQNGLLPPDLPDVPGWASAVLYRPAGEIDEVGGDFYDVFRGPDGWMLVIGDVAGAGAEAATRTSLARFTARTAAEVSGDVSVAVHRLNDTLRGQPGLPLCTVVCAALTDVGDQRARLTLACAGHPPPLLVRGREVIPLGHPGTIAGAFDGEDWPAATVELLAGDVLVFYTDGVLDAVGERDRFGERRLEAALRGSEGSVQERLAALQAALDEFRDGPSRDDTTVLLMEYQPAASPPASLRAASSITASRLQKANRTSVRPASASS
jgi:PAS domain S-box-containing protein